MGDKSKTLSSKQLKAIELMATEPDMPCEDMCKVIGCSESTLYKWKQNPIFVDKLVQRSREILKETLPSIYKVLGTKGKSGSTPHIKILLDHQEKLEEMQKRSHEGMITFSWKLPERESAEESPLPPEEEDEE